MEWRASGAAGWPPERRVAAYALEPFEHASGARRCCCCCRATQPACRRRRATPMRTGQSRAARPRAAREPWVASRAPGVGQTSDSAPRLCPRARKRKMGTNLRDSLACYHPSASEKNRLAALGRPRVARRWSLLFFGFTAERGVRTDGGGGMQLRRGSRVLPHRVRGEHERALPPHPLPRRRRRAAPPEERQGRASPRRTTGAAVEQHTAPRLERQPQVEGAQALRRGDQLNAARGRGRAAPRDRRAPAARARARLLRPAAAAQLAYAT
eukprot:scaffold43801_cov48-Phaeocystis_antarctica.AAC.3